MIPYRHRQPGEAQRRITEFTREVWQKLEKSQYLALLPVFMDENEGNFMFPNLGTC